MNLSGLQQRIGAGGQGQKGGGAPAIMFRSRPILQREAALRAEKPQRPVFVRTAWRASVRDEIHSTTHGAVRRRISILITEGTQLDSEEAV